MTGITRLIALTLSLITTAAAHAARDTVSVVRPGRDTMSVNAEGERTSRFYDSIQAKTDRTAVSRFLYHAFFVSQSEAPIKTAVDRGEEFEKYEGKVISQITLERSNVFDSNKYPLERFANHTHMVTREQVILRDLLIAAGEKLDPEALVSNEHHLKSNSYIYSVETTVERDPADTTKVIVHLHTRDKWSIGVGGILSGNGASRLDLYDENLLGTGTKLMISNSMDWKELGYKGFHFEYLYPNLFRRFFALKLVGGRYYQSSTQNILEWGGELARPFLKPTDYMAGASYLWSDRPFYQLYLDSTINVAGYAADVWGGMSRFKPSLKGSLYWTARATVVNYSQRPDVGPRLNPYFHDYKQFLVGAGIYREKFYTANLIFGFGSKEYLASGYRLELTGGVADYEFGDLGYLGGSYRVGGFVPFGNISVDLAAGSYINARGRSPGAASAVVKYYSNLLGKGRTRIRQFVELSHIWGWDRLLGNDEVIEFTRERGLVAYAGYAFGRVRTVLNTETVVFTPFRPIGFRMAVFGFANLGLLGNSNLPFENTLFTTLGCGIRLHNDHLIFKTIQIRLGIAVGKKGFLPSNYISVSSLPNITPQRYIPVRPGVVAYE